MKAPVTVMKFGSSVLSDRSRLSAVVHDVYRAYRRGERVIAVVSAIGDHTDGLVEDARFIADPALPQSALAKLLSTGEERSAALLRLAMHRAGIPATLLDVDDINLVLLGDRLDGDPYSLNRRRLETVLADTPVAILPGFIGRHQSGGRALMGRGGSDLTAVFVAAQMKASSCRLVKDVDGIYEHDPADVTLEAAPRRFATVSYEDARRVASVLVQPKAVEYLQCTHRTAEVTSLLHDHGTVVGETASRLSKRGGGRRLHVAMVGLGTVGLGVYRHLAALPELFAIEAIGVRDKRRHAGAVDPAHALYDDIGALLEQDFDALIDVSGDSRAAKGWIETCFRQGRDVVTANKRLLVRHGERLCPQARRYGSELRYSAAVGAGAPMLETVRRAAQVGPIREIRGVLNGTCNFVLDRMLEGDTFDEALAAAKSAGYTEADPARDTSGTDSRDKLRLLAYDAWGIEHAREHIHFEGIEDITREQVTYARQQSRCLRLVARMLECGQASVRAEWLALDDFLAGARGHENRLEVIGEGGQIWRVAGSGAGRWPTAEAVIADVVDIWYDRQGRPLEAPVSTTFSERPPRLSCVQ